MKDGPLRSFKTFCWAIFLVGSTSALASNTAIDTRLAPQGNGGDSIFSDGFELSASLSFFASDVQPMLVSQCGSCHLRDRFAFASLSRAGATFTANETAANYRTFKTLISLDAPEQSRLLAKVLPATDPRTIAHGGGALLPTSSAGYQTLLQWIGIEKAESCADCGQTANKAYVAYLDQPAWHWAVNRQPVRSDWGLRSGAKIMLQPINPATMAPIGASVDFLGSSFCGSDGQCDFGRSSASHAGDKLVFECRVNPGASNVPWLDLSWNICVAEIGPDGHAQNPRFLRPAADRHQGWSIARINPLGMLDSNGRGLLGSYDPFVQMRKKNDYFPIFSPDDSRIYFSSRSADPRSGVGGTRAYHGFEHTNNIISTKVDGTDARSVYLNEGGTALEMTFLSNGNLALHVWNIERMDRHLYLQMSTEGMMEMPVLFGRTQGRNMWGGIAQLANGRLIGMTGRRRGSISNFVPFSADHTVGTGIDPAFPGFKILDPALDAEMDETFAYCNAPPNGANCSTSHFYEDPGYAPDGRALMTYSPNRTYYSNDDSEDGFWQNYGGSIAAVMPYVPELRIALLDSAGNASSLLTPPSGRAYRYPTWVGKRQAPALQQAQTNEAATTAELHIADVPLWLSFAGTDSQNASGRIAALDRIVAVRVLSKEIDGNACTSDGLPYRQNVWTDVHDHPTHLGINNATAYTRYVVPQALGGDVNGDIPLKADKSVRLIVPAGKLLLFQGIDAQAYMVAQHSRVFALPPGHVINSSVKRSQYNAQCSACHGTNNASYIGVGNFNLLAPGMDFNTNAIVATNLSSPAVGRELLTFKHFLRPVINAKCVGCHGASSPAGDLTLAENYSNTANYPVPGSKWASFVNGNYASAVPANKRVYGYNWSSARNFVITEAGPYANEFINPVSPYAPMGALAPWDPGYQALYLPSSNGELYFLTDMPYPSNYGRGGSFAKSSFLLEVLTGEDLDPRKQYTGAYVHTGLLSQGEIVSLKALIDNGFPYMSRCDDTTVQEGINAGLPWGDSLEQDHR